ncbi:helix-turn-helix domain-containing protein [Nocardia sp. NPDC003482]
MSTPHSIACARRIVRDVETAGGTTWDAVRAIRAHCGMSLLRAHRMAHGYTLVDVAHRLRESLDAAGVPNSGVSHQSVSRWETGLDMPSYQFLDALCRVYRTRPDRLGFGHDYTDDRAAPAPAAVAGVWETVRALEESVESSGYLVYVQPPSEYIPARMRDLAQIQHLMLADRSAELRRRLLRVEAIVAGLIAFRLNDVADIHDTFMWFAKARRAARQAGDTAVEAWLRGHLAHGHECYRHQLDQGLAAAHSAQAAGARSACVFGLLAEAGIQARIGRRREAVGAITTAERMFAALPATATGDDNLGTSEYILRWHQAHTLSAIGDRRAAQEMRARVLELPMADKDRVGRALLDLDLAAMLEREGELEQACALIRNVWLTLPAELRVGQIQRALTQVVARLPMPVRDTVFGR